MASQFGDDYAIEFGCVIYHTGSLVCQNTLPTEIIIGKEKATKQMIEE